MQSGMKWYHGVVSVIIAFTILMLGFNRGHELVAVAQAEQVIENQEWETVKMNVSAYCPCTECCDHWGEVPVSSGKRTTASGRKIV